MTRRRTWRPTGLLLVAATIAACGTAASEPAAPTSDEVLRVTTSTSMLADLVETVGGSSVDVEVIVPDGADPHTFALGARQRAALADAHLVVLNGLGLEAAMHDVMDQVAAEGTPVVELAPQLDPVEVTTDDDDHDDADEATGTDTDPGPINDGDDGDEHDHGPLDPHVWLDPDRMAVAGDLVAAELADLTGATYDDGATAWRDRMGATAVTMEADLAAIPEECRELVTGHDSLRTFGARFDLDVVGAVVPGLSTDAQASAANAAALLDLIEARDVHTIFVEDTASPDAAVQLAAQLDGVDVVAIPVATLRPEGPSTLAELLTSLSDIVGRELASCA